VEPGATGSEPSGLVVRTAMFAVFAGGFAGLAIEVVWTRLLVFFLQGFTATFAAMLGAFLLGSAIGGAVFGRVAGRSRQPMALLGWLQLAVALAAAGSLVLLDDQFAITRSLRGSLAFFDSASANHKLMLLAAAVLVLAPPAFFLGGLFPAAARAATGGLDGFGGRLGRLYAANTVGAVLGALAAGFVFIPALGARPAAIWLAVLPIFTGVACLGLATRCGEVVARPSRRLGAVLVWVLAIVVVLPDAAEPMIVRSVVFQGPRGRENVLIEAVEGKSGLASVVRNERNGFVSLYTDEFLAASTEGRYRYMRMLGHIPMVLAAEPKDVLVMAFGTGTTAGSLSTHPTVERLDVVEISREVLEVAHHFESVNRGVLKLEKPEVRVFTEDARRYVLASSDTYDVITLEPLLPYTPGAVHLYTVEFYDLCRQRLNEGGAMCQWIPIHAMSSADFAMLTRSFTDVFPETSLWLIEETVALVGTKGPQGAPVARSARRLSEPGPREDLLAGKLDDLAQWWAFRICGPETLRDSDWLKNAAPMTDERPDLEFRPVPQGALTTFLHDNLVVALDLRDAENPVDSMDTAGLPEAEAKAFLERLRIASEATAIAMDGRASQEVFNYHAGHTRVNLPSGELQRHLEKATAALRSAVSRFGQAVKRNPRDRVIADQFLTMETVRLLNEGKALLNDEDAAGAVTAYSDAIGLNTPWNRDEAWLGMARARLALGQPVSAREAVVEALRIYPRNRDAQALMGQVLAETGKPLEAWGWFDAAYEGDSGPSEASAALLNARARADKAATEAGGGTPLADDAVERLGDPRTVDADEVRAALGEALQDVATADGKRRE
ncbi:MAG: spermidine synthase, partial [Planctomycetota bacterium]